MKAKNKLLFLKLGGLLSNLTDEQLAKNAELQVFAHRINNALFNRKELTVEELAEYDDKAFLENLIDIAKGL